MVRYMKTAFADLVIKSDWIDRPTKIAILRKNSQPLAAIGYPEWLFMDKKLDELNSIKVFHFLFALKHFGKYFEGTFFHLTEN